MIKRFISRVVDGRDLTREEMKECMDTIMSGGATPAQIASFITALRLKGETVDEITGAAEIMRARALRVDFESGKDGVLVDTCGTGGSGKDVFNISTASAFVAAGAGVKVAKHGNRAVSGSCGSADVLKALGVNIEMNPERVRDCIKRIGIGFLYAPLFHGAMKYAIGPRREIGIRTIFNILGPLTNPAGANCQVLGVYDGGLTEKLAAVLKNLGSKRALVVHGDDGLDEVSISGRTKVSELNKGRINTYFVEPEDFGLNRHELVEIKGGDAEKNSRCIREVLSGREGPYLDAVLINASCAVVAAGLAKGFREGVAIAAESIRSGRAMEKLKQLIDFTNEVCRS